MCDVAVRGMTDQALGAGADGGSSPHRRAPRWGSLYAIWLGAAIVIAIVELAVSAPALRALLRGGVVATAFAAMVAWVRTNRVALDLSEACSCASGAATVRIVRSMPRAAIELPAGSAEDGEPAELERVPLIMA